jgi:hypothetical protein
VASSSARLLTKAFNRVEARHRVTNPESELSFDVLLAEALVEVQAVLSMRMARDLRKMRRAAKRRHADGELLARIPSIAAAAEAPPEEQAQAGRPPPGPPAWHPEHPLNSDN